MRRSWLLWFAFALCLGVVLAAMGWISLTALRLDRAEAKARHQAAVEEDVRLALWRMDSALAPIIAQESARPYFAYGAFLPVNRAYGRMFNTKSATEAVVPSPLLTGGSPYVQVYFQYDPAGRLTSPRVPSGSQHRWAVPRHISQDVVDQAVQQLARMRSLAGREELLAKLPECAPVPREVVPTPREANQLSVGMNAYPDDMPQQQVFRNDVQMRQRGADEFNRRSQTVQNAAVMLQSQQVENVYSPPPAEATGPTDVNGVLMTPMWLGEDLLLARRVVVGGQEYVQGCLLDWPRIKGWLLESVADLLPQADLQPLPTAPQDGEWRTLAALPVRLVPGTMSLDDGLPSPIRITLAVAWGCVLLAAAAVAALLWGVLRLSNRRAAFVSAVTHELRTPLTTFQMYTEMLSEGMVPDAQQQQHYFRTLRAESSRLTHLVENVLAYARLERGRVSGRMEEQTVGRLIEPIRGRLADRAGQAGMELVVEGDAEVLAAVVRSNASAVEQILFNLVDNACKYAAGAEDRRIHLAACCCREQVQLCVRDHGPGLPGSRAGGRWQRLFRPFSKSVQEAANSAPGVGLGLALSQRLAHDMGGRLRVEPHTGGGACLVLSLGRAL